MRRRCSGVEDSRGDDWRADGDSEQQARPGLIVNKKVS